MKCRRRAVVQDIGVIGWISISEVFLLCGVTMLAIALAVESNLNQTKEELVNIKNLESEVPGLKQSIDKLEADRARDRREISELNNRLVLAKREASKLTDELAALGRDLMEFRSEQAILRKTQANLTATRDRLMAERDRLTAERDVLASNLKHREAELALARIENQSLTSERLALQLEIKKLNDRLIRIDESIVMPLKSAKLIVKINCDKMPEGYDLDLYVQDPHEQVCSWVQPRTLWENNETGLLILSEDLRNLRSVAEEIYYSPIVEPSDVDHPYLVFCMLRAQSSKAQPTIPVTNVRWKVSMDWRGQVESIGEGVVPITTPGRVVYTNKSYSYPGLVPLAGFRKATTPSEKPWVLEERAIPRNFRGWAEGNVNADATIVTKARDN